MPRGPTVFYKQGHFWGNFSTCAALLLAALGFALSGHPVAAHWLFFAACPFGAESIWIPLSFYGFRKIFKSVAAIAVVACIFMVNRISVDAGHSYFWARLRNVLHEVFREENARALPGDPSLLDSPKSTFARNVAAGGMANIDPSFCWYSFVIYGPQTASEDSVAHLMLVSVGQAPLRSATARLLDFEKSNEDMAEANRRALEVIRQGGSVAKANNLLADATNTAGTTVFKIGDVAVGGPRIGDQIPQILLTGRDHHAYNIFFTSMEGSWTEWARFRVVNGQWKKAVRVFKPGDQAMSLIEQIDPGFPETSGQVNWAVEWKP